MSETPWKPSRHGPRQPEGVDWSTFIGRRLHLDDDYIDVPVRPDRYRGTVVENPPGTEQGKITLDLGDGRRATLLASDWDITDMDTGKPIQFTTDGREIK